MYARQIGIADPKKLQTHITVVGAGAIGSHVVVALAKMGCGNISVWDPDVVEVHNKSNQLFLHDWYAEDPEDKTTLRSYDALGKKKVHVLRETVERLSGITIKAYPGRLSESAIVDGIVISGVDSMEARTSIWNKNIKNSKDTLYYIDGRMGGQIGQLFHLNPNDTRSIQWYETKLPKDEDVSDLPCTMRSICYTQFGMASIVSSIVRQILVDQGVTVHRELTMDFHNGIIVPSSELGRVTSALLLGT